MKIIMKNTKINQKKNNEEIKEELNGFIFMIFL